MLVNLFKNAPCWINIIVTDNFTQKCVLYQPVNYANYVYQLVTSTHVLMNGVFSVLFEKCRQFVLCVISESFLIVCLF